MNKIKTYLMTTFLALLLFGCAEEFAEVEEPAEDVAVAFFDAIYNQNNIDKAKRLSTPELAAQIGEYMTAKNVARRLFNMSYDSVEVHAALGDVSVKQAFERTGQLTMLFTGERYGKTVKELKNIRLVKNGNSWLVAEVLPDPEPF